MTRTLHDVMTEIGPLLEVSEVVEYAERHLWTLKFDDGAVMEVVLDEANHRVVLTMEIGDLPADRAADLSATLLRVNLLWRETGGVRFALADNTVTQLLDLVLDRADLPTLAMVAQNLHTSGLRWRAFLSAPPAAPDGQSAPLALGAIRV